MISLSGVSNVGPYSCYITALYDITISEAVNQHIQISDATNAITLGR